MYSQKMYFRILILVIEPNITLSLVRCINANSLSLENKLFRGNGDFLKIFLAFNRVWWEIFLFKLRTFLPSTFFLLINSHITD